MKEKDDKFYSDGDVCTTSEDADDDDDDLEILVQ